MPKEKVTLYLEPEMKTWLESQVDEEQKVSAVVRNLIRKAMKLKSRKKQITTVNDPFSFYNIYLFNYILFLLVLFFFLKNSIHNCFGINLIVY